MNKITRTSIVAILLLVLTAVIFLVRDYFLIYDKHAYDKHADDQEFRQFIAVTAQWQTITFDKPLKINRKELQCLRIGIPRDKYQSALGFVARRDWEAGVKDSSAAVGEYIVRTSDEKFILPELELIDGNGDVVKLKHSGIASGTGDEFFMEYSNYYKSNFDPTPPYPGTSDHFKAMRIRASEPFEVAAIDWWAAGL